MTEKNMEQKHLCAFHDPDGILPNVCIYNKLAIRLFMSPGETVEDIITKHPMSKDEAATWQLAEIVLHRRYLPNLMTRLDLSHKEAFEWAMKAIGSPTGVRRNTQTDMDRCRALFDGPWQERSEPQVCDCFSSEAFTEALLWQIAIKRCRESAA